jgi:periplasmic protein CpxP/Spy
MNRTPSDRVRPARIRLLMATLAVAAAGTLGTVAWAAGPGEHGMHGMHGGGGQHRGMGMMGPRMVERMLDAVNATPEQRSQVQQIVRATHGDLQAQREAGRKLRDQQMQLFTQPTVDARAVETLRQQMLAQHDQASKRMAQAMLDVSRVLTPEQRKQLAERLQQRRGMMERHRAEREQLEGNRR